MKLLPAVILEASKQSYKVKRLVDYCRDLDGTEVQAIKLPGEIDATPHPIGVERAVRYAGEIFDEPWIYMEADSIPIKKGWREKISEEYYASGKLFMLPSLEGCSPFDIASAIGVFPGKVHRYLPGIPSSPPWFDFYIYQNLNAYLHLTKQILHRYGHYKGENVFRRYEFPRDKAHLTPEAVIFHADPTQSIIRGGLLQSFFHSGDYGDIIAALPIIKQQGGGRLFLGPHPSPQEGKSPRMTLNHYKYGFIQPLLASQPYIKEVIFSNRNDASIDFDFSIFRLTYRGQDNLGGWQGRCVGRTALDMSKWLEIDSEWTGRVAVSRSLSYHNHLFPWKQIAENFYDRTIFVGHPSEHEAWEELTGMKVDRAETENFLDVARVLNGCEFHFGNQSAPSWITMGLGKTMIMEVWPQEPNSIVRNCPQSIFAQTRQDMKSVLELIDAHT